jgi:hypothetical protein
MLPQLKREMQMQLMLLMQHFLPELGVKMHHQIQLLLRMTHKRQILL